MIRARLEAAGVALLGGAAACCVGVVLALAVWLAYAGFAPFWPTAVIEVSLRDGTVVLGERAARFDDAQVLRASEIERLGGARCRDLPHDDGARPLRSRARRAGQADPLGRQRDLRLEPAAALIGWSAPVDRAPTNRSLRRVNLSR